MCSMKDRDTRDLQFGEFFLLLSVSHSLLSPRFFHCLACLSSSCVRRSALATIGYLISFEKRLFVETRPYVFVRRSRMLFPDNIWTAFVWSGTFDRFNRQYLHREKQQKYLKSGYVRRSLFARTDLFHINIYSIAFAMCATQIWIKLTKCKQRREEERENNRFRGDATNRQRKRTQNN